MHSRIDPKTIIRLTKPIIFSSFVLAGIADQALAGDECGIAALGNVTCTDAGNPYAGGITYTPTSALTVDVQNGVVVNRAPGTTNYGVHVTGPDTFTYTLNLDNGVTVNTRGDHANGVYVDSTPNNGSGDIYIVSGANIFTVRPVPRLDGQSTNGIQGLIRGATSTGDINIEQLANSTVQVTGERITGIYGRNLGLGSVYLTSAGNIVVSGSNAGGAPIGGMTAASENANGGDTSVLLSQTGSVTISGLGGIGLYSLTGGGTASVESHGQIAITGTGSFGAMAATNNVANANNVGVVLSDTAAIDITGDNSYGALAITQGLGNASVVSAGSSTVNGANAVGLDSAILNANSTATASVGLTNGGVVTATGDSAHGLYIENGGRGLSSLTMDAGTQVVVNGLLAEGAAIKNAAGAGTLGTAAITQAAGSSIAVSGAQGFGVNVLAGTGATTNLDGTVTSAGVFGVGASSFSTVGLSSINIGAGSTVIGGWQASVAGVGANTNRPSAGVLIGSGGTSTLANLGTIGAGSDRAVADIGRQSAAPGNLMVNNSGRITGFVEMAEGGANVFNNIAGGLFDARHFADTDGDGVRDTKRVSISDFGAAAGSSFSNLTGAMVRLAPVAGNAAFDAAGYYVPTSGGASTPLDANYYSLSRAGLAQAQFTNLGTFSNAGIIDLRGSATGNTLLMTSNATAGGAPGNGVFTSNGGQLLLNTVFNEGVSAGNPSGSFSDALIVDRTQLGTGATTVAIDRREGVGATTPGNGILVVEVRDKAASAANAFALKGDYVVNGMQTIIGGAYAYNLFQNGVGADAADGNWYLRSSGQSPNVPIYEAYPRVLASLVDVPTLQQRIGNRYWKEPSMFEPQGVLCSNPDRNDHCAVKGEQSGYYIGNDGKVIIENNAMWVQIDGSSGRFYPSGSTSDAHSDTNFFKIRSGLDGLLAETSSGKLIGGVTLQHGTAWTDIGSTGTNGSFQANGYGLGGTLTWYGDDGLYVDGQVQFTWLDSDITSKTLMRQLAGGNKGFGTTVSVEAGKRFALDQNWTLIPQAQLVYTNLHFDSFTDSFGTRVSLSNGDGLRGRFGLAAEYQKNWKEKDGTLSRLSVYGIANFYNEFLDAARLDVSGAGFSSGSDRLWGGIGLGGSYSGNNDVYSIYGQVLVDTSLSHFGDSHRVGGTLGLRVKW